MATKPRQKQYLSENSGMAVQDIIIDIPPLRRNQKEWKNYPTQKPVKLLQRLISAVTKPDDIVLDPFCGCASTLIAAEYLSEKRKWIGIDIPEKAVQMLKERMEEDAQTWGNVKILNALTPEVVKRQNKVNQRMGMKKITLPNGHVPKIPRRTDLGKEISKKKAKDILYGTQSGNCVGCGTHFQKNNLTIDHIIPKCRQGTDHLENMHLMCGDCNSIKGTRTMAEFTTIMAEKLNRPIGNMSKSKRNGING